MCDLPMLDELQRGPIHLFHGEIGHAAEIDGALALSAGDARHSLFDNADARGQGPGGALIGGIGELSYRALACEKAV
jgi:hypothetical protein